MKKKVEALEITTDSKQELEVELDALSQTKEKEVEIARGYPWLEHLMESNLFQNLNTGIKNLLKTHELEGMDMSVDELELLVNAQKDLVRLIKNTRV
jgi:hypothetical protein